MEVEKTEAEACFDRLARENPARLQESWSTLISSLDSQRIHFGDAVLPTNLKPHFISNKIHAQWVTRTEDFCALLETVATHVARSPELLKMLGFGERAMELFAIETGLERATFNARPDALWTGKELKFVEFNSDSPAMMTFTDRVEDLQRSLFPLCEMADQFDIGYTNRTRCLYDAIIAAYRQVGGDKENPTIAIVDWAGQKTRDELIHTGSYFKEFGSPTVVCDPRDLSLRNGRLVGGGVEIDIVQRRVLFPEFIERFDELDALITAHREQRALLINPLKSYLVGNKAILAFLHGQRPAGGPEGTYGMSQEDIKAATSLVPLSLLVNDETRKRLTDDDRARWVLKPTFGHGGQQVKLGAHMSGDEWRTAVEESKDGHWIAQEAIQIPTYDLPDCSGSEVHWRTPYINWTPWVFGGRFAGGTSRCSADPKVSITQQGALLPALSAT